MKHFRKVSAVLLAAVMVAVMLPSLLSLESAPVEAAEAGVVTNGGFETYESYTGGSGQTAWKAEGWTVRDWGITLGESGRSGKGARFSKDSSHKDACELTQVVPVNTNATYTFSFYAKAPKTDCDYVACFTYSLDLGTTSGSFGTALVSKATVNPGGTSWKQFSYTVNTGSNKYLQIRFFGTGVGSGDSYLDDVALTVVNAGDTGTHAKPSLKAFATDKNWPNGAGSNANDPANCTNNIIKQPGFESTTNAQWNTDTFITGPVSRVTGDAEGAHSGSAYLKYYRGTVALTTWPVFEITCPTAGDYVFSAWVRTPNLSSNNQGKASIGIIDRDTGKFLTYSKIVDGTEKYYGHMSTPEIQIRSTATDDEWHLRSVTFYVGAANSNIKIGMYGLGSTMYVDDISVHLLSNGVTYAGDQKGALSASTSVSNKYCESEDNLIADCNMNGAPSKEFWTKNASGWNNGMLNFQEDPQNAAHGNALHFKGTNTGSNKLYNYIKWVYVEPNTSYTVSFDYRVVSAGNQLMFIDNNIESPVVFHTPNLGSVSNSWKTYSFTFSTGNYNRIGIVLRNHASAELYLDDFRFFKNSDGIANEPAEEVFPTLKADHPEKYTSRSDNANGEEGNYGLGFLFKLKATGVTRTEWYSGISIDKVYVADYTNGKVQAFEDGVDYKLVKAGAVITNDSTVGLNPDSFVLKNAGESNGVNKTIDVQAKKLWYNPDEPDTKKNPGATDGEIYYGIRIVGIPEANLSSLIYARPYYVFEYEGVEVIVYGDIVSACYKTFPDINDGWLEWD